MANIDKEAVKALIKEMEELLAMRQGFVDEYREWRATAAERVKAACGEACAEEFQKLGPRDAPINRQHRVHTYRQTLVAQIRYLNQLLEQNSD